MTKSDSDTETQKNDGSIEKSIVIELIFQLFVDYVFVNYFGL